MRVVTTKHIWIDGELRGNGAVVDLKRRVALDLVATGAAVLPCENNEKENEEESCD